VDFPEKELPLRQGGELKAKSEGRRFLYFALLTTRNPQPAMRLARAGAGGQTLWGLLEWSCPRIARWNWSACRHLLFFRRLQVVSYESRLNAAL